MFLGSPAFPHTTSSVDYPPPTSVRLRLSRMAQLPHDGPDRKEDVWSRRADKGRVRDACLNAYKSYLTHWHAAPHDELRLLSKAPVDIGPAVVSNITFTMPPEKYAQFFETVIRSLGGRLSAFALSHPILLARAGTTSAPHSFLCSTPLQVCQYFQSTLVERLHVDGLGPPLLGRKRLSCQLESWLEYKYYLAYLTGTHYHTALEKVMEINRFAEFYISVGAFADCAYQYMIKQWLLSGPTDTNARDLYLRSEISVLENLYLYITQAQPQLTCFLPGAGALGAAIFLNVPRTHLWAARGLANTYEVVMSVKSESSSWDGLWATHLARWERSGEHGDPPGLRPVEPVQDEHMGEYKPNKPGYLLRPETVESFYLLWRNTGDVVWRERGWAVFEAISNVTRIEDNGFASISNGYYPRTVMPDQMPR
ncbi:glycoside hydrolase [Russula brevipes]|nr:glycoside hydrolase [Russula brevipes]